MSNVASWRPRLEPIGPGLHIVQSSMTKPGTLAKSAEFRVSSTKPRDSAIEAIRKSIVSTRNRRGPALCRQPRSLRRQTSLHGSTSSTHNSPFRIARPYASTSSNAGSSWNEPTTCSSQSLAGRLDHPLIAQFGDRGFDSRETLFNRCLGGHASSPQVKAGLSKKAVRNPCRSPFPS